MPDQPAILTPEQYQAVIDHTARTAPAGLSPEAYQAQLEDALHEATLALQPKTISGFAGNLLTSGGKAVANAAEGFFGAARAGLKNVQAMTQPTPENIQMAASDPMTQGIAQAVMHPLDTAGRVVNYAVDRYGSPSKLANTLYRDPVGAVVDASTVASLGGGALTRAGQLANLPTVARAGQVVSALDPVAAAGNTIRRIPVRNLAEGAAERLSESALKLKDTLRDANPGQNIPLDAAREGAVVSRGGLRNLNTRLGALDADVQAAVDASPAMIDPWAASQEARDLIADRQRLTRATTPREIPIMQRTVRQFVGNGVAAPAREMQDVKSLFGTKLTNTFGAEVIPAEQEAQQALRAGTRRVIEQQVPGVVEPNAQMTRLIPVRDAVQDAVNRSSKWDIGQILKTSGGAGIGGLIGLGAGHPDLGALAGATAMRVLDNPAVKSRLATATLRAGEAAPAIGAGLEALTPYLVRLALLKQMGGDQPSQPQQP